MHENHYMWLIHTPMHVGADSVPVLTILLFCACYTCVQGVQGLGCLRPGCYSNCLHWSGRVGDVWWTVGVRTNIYSYVWLALFCLLSCALLTATIFSGVWILVMFWSQPRQQLWSCWRRWTLHFQTMGDWLKPTGYLVLASMTSLTYTSVYWNVLSVGCQ